MNVFRKIPYKNILKYGTLTTGLSGLAYYNLDEKTKYQVDQTGHSIYRVLNLASTASLMISDYAYIIYWKSPVNKEERSNRQKKLIELQNELENWYIISLKSTDPIEVKESKIKISILRKEMDILTEEIGRVRVANRTRFIETHQRNAIRLRDMCAKNGGLYIKLGQHMAMLDHILPLEYQESLTTLLANTPTSSLASVRRIFHEDLGKYPEELFDSFDPKPIASASLAQVHIAYKDGKKYAIKIQHEGLREHSSFDCLVITKLVDSIPMIFPEFKYQWLTKEMNQNLPLELDFQVELTNIQQASEFLTSMVKSGDVAIPDPIPQYSSSRILTMTFEEGCHLNNLKQINQYQLSYSKISTIVSKTFAEQIFRHGFVHCDPHEANLLVRPNPKNPSQPQVVLLDHGLYRQLDPIFRKEYCLLWKSIVLGDEKGIEKHAHALNAGELYTLLAAMLTMRPWDDIMSNDIDKLKRGKSHGDRVMLQSYAHRYMKEIVALLGQVPSDLLLVFKTNDCLRHLDQILQSPINSTAILASTVANVLLEEEILETLQQWQPSSGVLGWFGIDYQGLWSISHSLYQWAQIQFRVGLLPYLTWAMKTWNQYFQSDYELYEHYRHMKSY